MMIASRTTFLQPSTTITRRLLHVSSLNKRDSYKFLICGGGTGGLAVASSLARRFGESQVAVIEPKDVSTINHGIVCCRFYLTPACWSVQ